MAAMLDRLLRAASLALGLALFLAGCGGDDGPAADAAPAAPDREDLCPGALTFEALVTDLQSNQAVFDTTLAEVGNESNSATSAPNGRAVLCLPTDTASQVRSTREDHLHRLDAMDQAAAAIWYAADQPYPLHMITEVAAEALLAGLGLTRDEEDAQVIVSVLRYPGATPLVGAEVTIDRSHEGAFVRDGQGGFAAGESVGPGGLVLFANTVATSGQVSASVTPPAGFAGTCTGPTSAPVEDGAVTGLHFACQ
jgi:hypothetical protein